MPTAVIIDDEERARSGLQTLLTNYCPTIELIASCGSVPEGVLAINKNRPDIVFLDIEMPEYNGFDLLGFFREVDFEIIFVTAYNDYAIRAFEVAATDYLLKPVDIDKLRLAVEKATQRRNHQNMNNRLEVLKDSLSGGPFNKIALPASDGLLFIETADIVYLEADGAYTDVWLKNGSKIVVSKKLRFFEEILDGRVNFFRSHRSFIVNINYLKKYNKGENALTLDNGKTIVISRDKKSEFEHQLKVHNITIG